MLRPRIGMVALFSASALGFAAAQAGEAVASKSLTVQTAGVKGGKTGEAYFNVEGKTNGDGGKYASFGVLEFAASEVAEAGLKGGSTSLALAQSIARFSMDGKIKLYLATADFDTKDLKFNPSGTDGLGSQIGSKSPIGSGQFKKVETGKVDVFRLTLDDASKEYVEARAAKGEPVRIVVVPDDDAVAATYFGAGAEDAARRPKLAADRAK